MKNKELIKILQGFPKDKDIIFTDTGGNFQYNIYQVSEDYDELIIIGDKV